MNELNLRAYFLLFFHSLQNDTLERVFDVVYPDVTHLRSCAHNLVGQVSILAAVSDLAVLKEGILELSCQDVR